MNVLRFCKNWTLPLAMLSGVALYLIYAHSPWLRSSGEMIRTLVDWLQPILIFMMLFLTFCKVDWSDLRFCRWHVWLLLIQGGGFALLGMLLVWLPDFPAQVLLEGGMLCLICPTATAAAVVTRKLGGDAGHLTAYTMFINLLAAFIIPLLLPVIHPQPGGSFAGAFGVILGKVFPLLLCPLLAAFSLRWIVPALHARIARLHELSFYLWAVALTLAIAVTTKSIVHSEVSVVLQLGLALVSLVCCIIQFCIGKKIGRMYGDEISAGQALGQKNTVLGIWLGYTFFTPVTAVAAGFYSIWHNVFNSRQLYLQRKRETSV